MKNKFFLIAILIFTVSAFAQEQATFKDPRDGKMYKTVKIGTQTWMAENLAYKTSSGFWAYKDDVTIVTKYGYHYDWETAKKVCPTGWHLPSDAEWTELAAYLGGEKVAGFKMKSSSGWYDYSGNNGKGTNSSGFAGLPGGYRKINGIIFNYIGFYGYWWSSTELGTESAWNCSLYYYLGQMVRDGSRKQEELSVRCLKDL